MASGVLAILAVAFSEDEAVDVHAQSIASTSSGRRRRLVVLVTIAIKVVPADKRIAVTAVATLKALHLQLFVVNMVVLSYVVAKSAWQLLQLQRRRQWHRDHLVI